MSRARTGLLALLLPLLACDEPGTVTMRSVEMRQVGGAIVPTGGLEGARGARLARGGGGHGRSPVGEEEEFRAGAIDDGPRPRAEHPDRVDCGACTCDIVTWTCDCTQCRALGTPAT